jgi:hypothetical protein
MASEDDGDENNAVDTLTTQARTAEMTEKGSSAILASARVHALQQSSYDEEPADERPDDEATMAKKACAVLLLVAGLILLPFGIATQSAGLIILGVLVLIPGGWYTAIMCAPACDCLPGTPYARQQDTNEDIRSAQSIL